MNRRTYLALAGTTLAALAGCTADESTPSGSDGSPGSGESPVTGGGPATSPGAGAGSIDLDVTLQAIQTAVVTMTSPDSIGVRAADGKQYVRLHVRADGNTVPSADALSLEVGSTRSDPMLREARLYRALEHEETQYVADSGAGWLVFELPARGSTDDLALTWSDGEVPFRDWATASVDAVDARLSSPSPTLAVEWTPPDRVGLGDRPRHTFRVTNQGDRPTRFVAALNRSGPRVAHTPVAAVSRPVEAGGTEAWSMAESLQAETGAAHQVGDGESDMTYFLDWPGGEDDAGVRVVEATPTPTAPPLTDRETTSHPPE